MIDLWAWEKIITIGKVTFYNAIIHEIKLDQFTLNILKKRRIKWIICEWVRELEDKFYRLEKTTSVISTFMSKRSLMKWKRGLILSLEESAVVCYCSVSALITRYLRRTSCSIFHLGAYMIISLTHEISINSKWTYSLLPRQSRKIWKSWSPFP